MSSSSFKLIVLIIATSGIIQTSSSMLLQRADICAQLMNVKLQKSCDNLKTTFMESNCTRSEDCIDKEKMNECFHGLLFNGTNYSADDECLQFYCNCFEGEQSEMPDLESSSMNCTNCTTNEEPDQSIISNTTEVEDKPEPEPVLPELLEMEMAHSNHTSMNEDLEMDNSAEIMNGSLFSNKSDKYIRHSSENTDEHPTTATPGQRRGDRKPDYSTTTYHTEDPRIVVPTTSKNIYDKEHEDKESFTKFMDSMDSQQHHDGATHEGSTTINNAGFRNSVQTVFTMFFSWILILNIC